MWQWRYGLFRRPFAPAYSQYRPSYERYSYLGLHPMLLGALSGLLIWIGNSAVLLGREVGPALWMRQLLSSLSGFEWPAEAWEEMATFHLGGLLGNELLFRCYEWLAAATIARRLEGPRAPAVQLERERSRAKLGRSPPPAAWLAVQLASEGDLFTKYA